MWKSTMKKLVLLDADVIIDLHSLQLFDAITRGYDVYVVRTVFREARFYPYKDQALPIDIKDKVTIVDVLDEQLLKKVKLEAREAFLGIDPGETESIAYLSTSVKNILFCTCDHSAIQLISYMELEHTSISVEKALEGIGRHGKNLYPRHREKVFRDNINKGKILRIQYKKMF